MSEEKNNDNEIIVALIPKQYIGAWKNDEGKKLYIVQYVAVEDKELKKIFVPVSDYKELAVKTFIGGYANITIGQDDDDRDVILEIERTLDKDLPTW